MNGRELSASDSMARSRIANAIKETVLVEAGAGTGKTTELIARMTALLMSGMSGASVDRIAVITFTRAAAFELRSRVRKSLEARASDTADAEHERARAAAALAKLDDAAIQTIDSFALSMLRERPLEAGLPPVLGPQDEIESGLRFSRAWDAWLRESLESPDFGGAISRAISLGLAAPLRRLREVALEFHENYELLDSLQPPDTAQPERLAAAEIVKSGPRLKALLELCTDGEDRMARHLKSLVLPLAAFIEAAGADSDDALELVAEAGKLAVGKAGSQKNWPPKDGGPSPLREVRAILDGMQDVVDRELAAHRQAVLGVLLRDIVTFVRDYAKQRKVEGAVEFHDALVWARDMLRDSAEAREHFRERYERVLIDEFQDTDPLQVEIARLLTHRRSPDRPDAGALFVVGDPKQSIYRFRRADIRAYQSIMAEAPGGREFLTCNFRSVPPVLDWVNRVFAKWMAAGNGLDQASYVPLQPGLGPEVPVLAPLDAAPPPGAHRLGDEVNADDVDKVRRTEALAIAQLAHEIGSGKWQVRGADGAWRGSAYGDLAVLLPARSSLDHLQDALDALDVPYSLEGQSLVFATQDVRDLLNCLAAIDDPTDQVAIVAALRSPAFGCTDADLHDWVDAGGKFDYGPRSPDAQPGASRRVAEAFTVLEEFHKHRGQLPVSELIEEFIRERRLRELAVASGRPEGRLRRLQLIVELSRQLSNSGHISLREFLRWAEEREQSQARMAETALETGGASAVRVMTVHAAKGLEFPIVLLGGLSGDRYRRPSVIFGPRLQGEDAWRLRKVAVRIGTANAAFETLDYAELEAWDRQADEAEDVRLMYVAATRARDHLVVSVFRKQGDAASRAAKIVSYAEGAPGVWDEVLPRPVAPAGREHVRPDVPLAPFASVEWDAKRLAAIKAAARKVAVSPSSLKAQLQASAPAPKDRSPETDDEPWRTGRAATDLGRAVHAVLQEIDLRGRQRLESLARAHAARNRIPGEADAITRLALAILDAPLMVRAAEADVRGRCWREVRVVAPLSDGGPATLDGAIDLLFEDAAGKLVLIDYKTDRAMSGESLAEVGAPYQAQLGAYAWAVERTTGRKVSEAWVIFASRAEAGLEAEYRVLDISAAASEALALARQEALA